MLANGFSFGLKKKCVGQIQHVCGNKEEEDMISYVTNYIHKIKTQSCVICGIETRDTSPNSLHKEDVVKPTDRHPTPLGFISLS
jgi:hypothetical protein